MKETELIKHIIQIVVSNDDWNFEELRWLFDQYRTAKFMEEEDGGDVQ